MPWSVVWFGKYKGKSLPQIVLTDPDWFFWAIEKSVFEDKGVLRREAQEVYDKSTHIRIPKPDPHNWRVEYAIHPSSGSFSGLDIVEKSHPKHVGSTPTYRTQHIDMTAPRRMKEYDKFGGKLLVKSIKYYVFGKSEFKRCQEFFDNDENFAASRSPTWRKQL